MTETEIENFKVQLEAELQSITTELETFATLNKETGDWTAKPTEDLTSADENLAGDKVEEWNTRRALMAQIEVRYSNINHALDKIAKGTYGKCEISGEEIEIERLQANPAARTNLANIEREKELII